MVYSSYDVYHPKQKNDCDFIKYRKWQIPEHWDVEVLWVVKEAGG